MNPFEFLSDFGPVFLGLIAGLTGAAAIYAVARYAMPRLDVVQKDAQRTGLAPSDWGYPLIAELGGVSLKMDVETADTADRVCIHFPSLARWELFTLRVLVPTLHGLKLFVSPSADEPRPASLQPSALPESWPKTWKAWSNRPGPAAAVCARALPDPAWAKTLARLEIEDGELSIVIEDDGTGVGQKTLEVISSKLLDFASKLDAGLE